ncbi:MAG TPA: SRPBCC family protein [Polyangiaceae bacterium]|nr:SRPBCC family protein [Polyangiaceae bacterium]
MRTLHYAATIGSIFFASASAVAAPNGASVLSRTERDALLAGDVVSRPMHFETPRGSYVGGLSYSIVNAPAANVLVALSNVDTLPQALPRTKAAHLIDVEGTVARVELVQGQGAIEASYTVRLERAPGRSELRFRLDPTRPHDIEDVFGFFRVEPFGEGKSLVTVAAAIDLGPGIASLFFSDAVERVVLGAPRQIRDYVEPHAFAAL